MRLRRNRTLRRAMAALEVVLATALLLPMAAFLYWMLEQALDLFFFTLGTTVGWPYL